MSAAGKFKIDVWTGVYPVWCVISHEGKEISIRHTELSDLKYAVKKAMKEARAQLPDERKEEV